MVLDRRPLAMTRTNAQGKLFNRLTAGPSRFTTIDFARAPIGALQRPKMSHILTSGTAAPDFMLHVTPDQILSLRDWLASPQSLHSILRIEARSATTK
jgi:hypothetical protein